MTKLTQFNICNAIETRKSCRAYLNQNVNHEIIEKILEIARWAHSGVNHQPAQVAILGHQKAIQRITILQKLLF